MSNISDKTPTISNNVLEVLDIVTRHDFVHIREISRLADISPTTASSILKELEENGILAKKVLGKNCFYSITKNHKTRKMIGLAEGYKFMKQCSDNNFCVFAEDLVKSIPDIKNLIDAAICYREKNEFSLLFITSLDAETIKSRIGAKTKTGKLTVFTRENFRNNLDNDLIKNILKEHVVIFGIEKFVDIVY